MAGRVRLGEKRAVNELEESLVKRAKLLVRELPEAYRTTATLAAVRAEVRHVVRAVRENVEINGFSWNEADEAGNGLESFTPELMVELEKLQAHVTSLSEAVAQQRRTAPIVLAGQTRELQRRVDRILATSDAPAALASAAASTLSSSSSSSSSWSLSISPQQLKASWESTLDVFEALKSDIPVLASQLEQLTKRVNELPEAKQRSLDRQLRSEADAIATSALRSPVRTTNAQDRARRPLF